MMVIIYWDFFGDADELKEVDKHFKKMGDESEGVEYLGRYAPTGLKWHWAYFYKCESEEAWIKRKRIQWDRDYTKWTHGIIHQYM
jgi:hypothetical protein